VVEVVAEDLVASSTSDATVRDAAKHPRVPLRRVRAGEVRCEDSLYDLKAGPAGSRPSLAVQYSVASTATTAIVLA
jgi:hypothetical protein